MGRVGFVELTCLPVAPGNQYFGPGDRDGSNLKRSNCANVALPPLFMCGQLTFCGPKQDRLQNRKSQPPLS